MSATTETLQAPESLEALSPEQWQHYQEHGYIVVEDLFDPAEVAEMLAECESIHRGDYGELFSDTKQVEPDLVEAAKTNPELAKIVRKISTVVERSVIFRRYLLKERMMQIIRDLQGPDVLLFRDILMMKPARHGSKMPWHQDSNYWPIDPPELTSAWTALDPATIENGCMRVIPGSHRMDLIPSADAGKSALRDEQVDLSQAIDVPMRPGSSLVFHSRLLHGSEPNRSEQHRRAFITSFMSAKSKLKPDAKGRRRFFLCCGKTYPDCVSD